ncbi:MAG: histidine phosphatase family protein [Bryobacterales bacterium]|nr:histidine phosphatase family protein [Bryobacterales bacterium]
MSLLYLIRHGQAGTRSDYDMLSDLGCRQAALLGQYFRSAGVRFQRVYSGALERQKQTAALVLESLPGAPDPVVDPRWNEFDLAGLWTHLAPRLIEADSGFARNYDLLHRNNPGVDREMTVCDVELIRAWMSGSHACNGLETWDQFRSRVQAPLNDLAVESGGDIAVFTSATPTAIWCGRALELDERRIFRVVSVLMNTSYSCFRLKGKEVWLTALNNAPHLCDPAMRTLR